MQLKDVKEGEKVLFIGTVMPPSENDAEGGLIVVALDAPPGDESGEMNWAFNPDTPCTHIDLTDDVEVTKRVY